MLVTSAAVPRLTVAGLGPFLEEVQVALGEIHDQIDETYFRPTFAGWGREVGGCDRAAPVGVERSGPGRPGCSPGGTN